MESSSASASRCRTSRRLPDRLRRNGMSKSTRGANGSSNYEMKAIVETRVYDARLKAVAITVVLSDSGWTAEGAYRKNEATVRL
jgi:hypothetical protein